MATPFSAIWAGIRTGRAFLRNAERGVQRGVMARVGGLAEKAGWNSYQSLMLRAGALYATGYAMKRYGEGYFSPEGQAVANVVGTGFQWTSYARLARAGTRFIGGGLRDLESARMLDMEREISNATGRPVPPGVLTRNREIRQRFKPSPMFSGSASVTGRYFARPGDRFKYGKMATAFEYGGPIDTLMAGLGPLALATRGAAALAPHVPSLASNVGTFGMKSLYGGTLGRGGYIRAAFGYGRAAVPDYATARQSWLGLAGAFGMLENPLSPFVFSGAAIGGAAAYAQRTSIPLEAWGTMRALNPAAWQYTNEPYGVAGDEGPLHADMFGGGIGQSGPSAVRSPDVVEGQLAVTRKMLSMRRM